MTLRERLVRPDALALAAVMVFAVLRFAALTRYPLWTDETWTLEAGQASLRTALRIHADDQTHPPLFYVALWFWRRIGPDSIAWVRMLPCLAGIATALPMLAIARAARMTTRATALAMLLGAGSGMLVAYSAEIRNYAFLALGGTASLALWIRARDNEGDARLARLTIVNILLVHVHYFGVLIVAAEWCDALLGARRRLRAMTASAAITAVSLAPWLLETARRRRVTGIRFEAVDWIPTPAPGDVLGVAREILGASPWIAFDLAAIVLLGGAIAAWTLKARGTPVAPAIRLLLLAGLIPIAFAYLFSVIGPRPIWVERYMIAAAPPLLLLAAGGLDAVVPRRFTAVAVAIALLPAAFTALSLWRGTAKPRYDTIVSAIASAETGAEARVFSLSGVAGFPIVYAVKHAPNLGRPVRVRGATTSELMNEPEGWAVWSERHPPRGVPPSAALLKNGFVVGPTLGFGFDRDSMVAARFSRPVPR